MNMRAAALIDKLPARRPDQRGFGISLAPTMQNGMP